MNRRRVFKRGVSLQLKIFLFFSICFLVLAASLVFIATSTNHRIKVLFNDRVSEESGVLDHDLANLTQLTKALAPDYSQWDDPYYYLLGKLPNYAKENLTDSTLETFSSDAMWMFYNDGKLVAKIESTEQSEGTVDFKPIQNDIKRMFEESYSIQFSIKTRTGVMQIFGSTVVPSDDAQHLKKSPGYLLVGKLINNETLSKLQGGERKLVTFVDPVEIQNYPSSFPVNSGKLVYKSTLKDIKGNIIGYVYANYEAGSIKTLYSSGLMILIFTATTFFSLLFALLVAVWRWVIRPVNKISLGLETANGGLLQAMSFEKSEFGKISGLMYQFFQLEKIKEVEIKEKKKFLEQLKASNTEIEQTNRVMIGRELKMIEMKNEIKALNDELKSKS